MFNRLNCREDATSLFKLFLNLILKPFIQTELRDSKPNHKIRYYKKIIYFKSSIEEKTNTAEFLGKLPLKSKNFNYLFSFVKTKPCSIMKLLEWPLHWLRASIKRRFSKILSELEYLRALPRLRNGNLLKPKNVLWIEAFNDILKMVECFCHRFSHILALWFQLE